jgi:hypothetical protein
MSRKRTRSAPPLIRRLQFQNAVEIALAGERYL